MIVIKEITLKIKKKANTKKNNKNKKLNYK